MTTRMKFALVRREPSEMMLHGAWREINMTHSQVADRPHITAAFRAMLAAHEPLTDAEIDELCVAYAYSNPHGPEWWWRRNTKGALAEHGEIRGDIADQNRAADRARFRAFLAAIGEEKLP